MMTFTPDMVRALVAGNLPIDTVPVSASSTVGVAPQDLLADILANLPHNTRRIRVVNTHATQIVSLILKAAGAAYAAETHLLGMQILAGQSLTIVVTSRIKVGIVGSAAGSTYNYTVSDV